MAHVDKILSFMPHLYRDGELLRSIMSVSAIGLEVFDEQGVEIQRTHWFDTAFDFEDVRKLAGLLDIEPETWQGLREFRAWVHSLRDAWLESGTVTRQGLERFIDEYLTRYQQAVGINAVIGGQSWAEQASEVRPALIENPLVRRIVKIAPETAMEPLHQEVIENKGLDPALLEFLLIGLPHAREYMPVIANITTNQALVYLGTLGPGERLWIKAKTDGTAQAYTDLRDVSNKLYSVVNLTPGVAWSISDAIRPAKALNINRGENMIWFLPVAHYDQPGLDRCLFALADLSIHQARWDSTKFDQALFYQDPAFILYSSWNEAQPATITVTLPGGILQNPAAKTEYALDKRERLEYSLNLGVQKIKAAGVAATTILLPFSETQGQRDALRAIFPKTLREVGNTGIDKIPDKGAAFDVTGFEDSLYR